MLREFWLCFVYPVPFTISQHLARVSPNVSLLLPFRPAACVICELPSWPTTIPPAARVIPPRQPTVPRSLAALTSARRPVPAPRATRCIYRSAHARSISATSLAILFVRASSLFRLIRSSCARLSCRLRFAASTASRSALALAARAIAFATSTPQMMAVRHCRRRRHRRHLGGRKDWLPSDMG